ncbi:hypothetical protein KSS87_012289 [Heliosperma pusillum]|nr:hypothetical protein KSS87_012289 [Heliosperma pusillum]
MAPHSLSYFHLHPHIIISLNICPKRMWKNIMNRRE